MLVSGISAFALADAASEDATVSSRTSSASASLALTSVAKPAPSIASISIVNDNIFDLENPEEDRFLYRLANSLHIKTRPDVVNSQLLFSEGDPLSTYELEESERILRRARYLYDASIEKSANDDGTVDIAVHTTDVWTLMPRFSFSRKGGVNTAKGGIKETNLFGTGRSVEVSVESDIDRDALTLGFADKNLGGSWYSLETQYSKTSDGHAGFFSFGKDFISLDATRANGLTFSDVDQIDYLYDRGEARSQFRHQSQYIEGFLGWSDGLNNGWSRRFTTGIVVDRHRFAEDPASLLPAGPLPDDRSLVYPFVGAEILQNRFEKTENVSQISRTEDHYLGTRFAARLGYAASGFGSDRNALLLGTQGQMSFGSLDAHLLKLGARWQTRIEDGGGLSNQVLEASADYYRRQSDHLLFFAGLRATIGDNLDIDNQILLGGDNGLRGYPLRYQSGEKRALLTLEQRLFSGWYPFRLFRVGGAVFFDAGRVWDSRYRDDETLLKDVGFGLRLGNSRSGLGNVIHIDVAFPLDGESDLDGVQLLVETRKSF